MDDWALLQQYVHTASETAFAELVRRHTDMVFSVCLRKLREHEMAEDVTQAVFIILAMKAKRIPPGTLLSGWLYTAACFAATDAQRMEDRRKKHERCDAAMRELNEPARPEWDAINPFIDDALTSLNQTERNAVLLRFFERKSLKEVGASLNLSAAAAEKRVSRALNKMRDFLGSRGAVTSSSDLMAVLPLGVVSAPAGLIAAAKTSALVVAKSALPATKAGLIAQGVLKTMLWLKIKMAASIVLALVFFGGGAVLALHRMQATPPPVVGEDQREPPLADKSQPGSEPDGQISAFDAGRVFSLVLLPDGKRLLTGGADTLHLWELKSGKELCKFENDLEEICSTAICADGTHACSGNARGLVQVWNVQTQKELWHFDFGSEEKASVAFSKDGKHVAGCNAEQLVLWDAESGQELWRVALSVTLNCLAFSGDGSQIVAGCTDGGVCGREVKTGKLAFQGAMHNDPVLSLACSPDGKYAASGDAGGTLLLWDLKRGVDKSFEGPQADVLVRVRAVVFLPTGKYLISAEDRIARALLPQQMGFYPVNGNEYVVRIWNLNAEPVQPQMLNEEGDDLRAAQEVAHLKVKAEPAALAVTPDGKYIVVAENNIEILAWPKEAK